MKRALIAVDESKYSRAVITSFHNLVKTPEEVVLLHVQKPGGKSLMFDMLGEAEMSTLKEMLEGTEHKEAMDRKAHKVLDRYRREIEGDGSVRVRTVLRIGHPAEEILKAAREEDAELIILGTSGRKGIDRLLAGSVAKEVERDAGVPVLVARNTLMCEEPYSWRDAYAAIAVCTALIAGLFIIGCMLPNGAALP